MALTTSCWMNDMPNASQIVVSPGYFKLGTQTKGGDAVDVARLRIFPAQKDSEQAGRWLLFIDPSEASDKGSASPLADVLTGVAARLGLLPPRLAKPLRDALQKPAPVALIADTSSLYTGVFEQVVRMRQGLPTHLAIPDQVYMELQRQRERKRDKRKKDASPPASPRSPLATWLAERKGAPPIAAMERVLSWLQHRSGQVLHQIRPADSLVRYFGGERGAGAEQDDHGENGYLENDDRIAENFYRDRLILEAVRAEQSRLHQLPMWVITSDEKLAVQARQEGFRVGYGERAQSPSPWLVGSPWVDPHTLGLRHIPALDLISELVQQWGVVTLQEEGKGKLQAWKKTDAKEQALGKPEPFTTHERQQQPWRETRLAHHSSPSAPPPPPESAPVCGRQPVEKTVCEPEPSQAAPPARPVPEVLTLSSPDLAQQTAWPIQIAALDHLINALLALQGQGLAVAAEALRPKGVTSYLVRLGWAESYELRGTKELKPTPLGARLSARWQALSPTDPVGVVDWARWLEDIAAQLGNGTPLCRLLALLPPAGVPGADPAALAAQLEWSQSALNSKVALGHHLGVLVRWDGLVYRTLPVTQQEAAAAIRNQVQGTTRVDSLFLQVLHSTPLGLPSFRIGLLALYESGQLVPGGGLPDATSTHKPVKLSVVVPTKGLPRTAERLEVDLANGDFLLPGVSCQVVMPREATR